MAHVDAQAGIEIGQGLVEQEEARLPDDGAADGDALALAAGQGFRPAFQQGLYAQQIRRLVNRRLDRALGRSGHT